MAIIDTRIDNRLLHGIVATQWAPKISPTRIMVIDDEVANNPVLKSSMKLGRPAGMAISIITEETAIDHFVKHMYDGQQIFILAKSPQIFADLVEKGVEVHKLTLGGTIIPEGDELNSAIKVHSRAYITKEEVPIYKKLMASGVNITAQYVPSDKVINLAEII